MSVMASSREKNFCSYTSSPSIPLSEYKLDHRIVRLVASTYAVYRAASISQVRAVPEASESTRAFCQVTLTHAARLHIIHLSLPLVQ